MNLENIIIIGIVVFIAIILIILLIVLLKKKSKIEIHRKRYMIDPIVKIDDKQYNELIKYGNSINNNTSGKLNYGILIGITALSFVILIGFVYWYKFGIDINDFEKRIFYMIDDGNVVVGLCVPISIFAGISLERVIRRIK
ncbi:MAG: hypothetical protein R3Y64_10900 [Peptostreptococcaceae bacterium]